MIKKFFMGVTFAGFIFSSSACVDESSDPDVEVVEEEEEEEGPGVIVPDQNDEQEGQPIVPVEQRAYVDLYKNADEGDYYFNVKSANHQTILSSEGYSSRTAALNGILSVMENATDAANFDVLEAADGKHYFNLTSAGNGSIIGTGQRYATLQGANTGVSAVTSNCANWVEFQATRNDAHFKIVESAPGANHFELVEAEVTVGVAAVVLMTSNSVATPESAWNGAFSAFENAADASRFEVEEITAGTEYKVIMKKGNGQVLAESEILTSQAAADARMAAIMDLIPTVSLL